MNKQFSIIAYCVDEILIENGIITTDLMDIKKYGTKKFFLKKNNLIELH
jgi:hypothetical protein